MEKTASLKLYVLAFILIISFLNSPCRATTPEFINPYFDAIWDYNRRLFPYGTFNWESHTWREFMEQVIDRSINPNWGIRRMRACEFFMSINSPDIPQKESSIIEQGTWQDLNFFIGDQEKQAYLAHHIDRTQTELGRMTLYGMLAQPITKVQGTDGLLERQSIIREFIHQESLFNSLDALFKRIQTPENVMLSLYSPANFERNVEFFNIRLPYLKTFNTSPTAVQANHLLSTQLLGRGMRSALQLFNAFILPAYCLSVLLEKEILTSDGKIIKQARTKARSAQTSGGDYIEFISWFVPEEFEKILAILGIGSGIYHLLNLVERKREMLDQLYFEQCLQTQMIQIRSYFDCLRTVHSTIENNTLLRNTLPLFKHLDDLIKNMPSRLKDLRTLFYLFKRPTFQGEPSFFSLHGHVLAAFNIMMKVKKEFKMALAAMGQIEVYHALAKLVKTSQNNPVSYSFVEYLDSPTPCIELTDVCNPFVDPTKVIPMSISLGGEHKPNAIITGPNAGGKSTILKGIAIALIIGQMSGIALAKRAAFTPFSFIATHLNIRDDIGVGNSLFKSEVIRAHQLLSNIETSKKGEFSAIFVDEMFKGTSAVEGAAAAYSFGLNLAQSSKSICMMATHFPLLTKLEQTTNAFTNYKVQVSIDPASGAISYPFTLTPGISNQHCAIAILQSEGFSADLLRTAEEVVTGTLVPDN